MKPYWAISVLAVSMLGCYQDPRGPIEAALRDINDIQAYQVQAERLRPLQDDLRRALMRDAHVKGASVGLWFSSSGESHHGTRLDVEYIILVELDPNAAVASQPAASQPDTSEPARPKDIARTLIRDALAGCGWEVERVDAYCYENSWRICGRVRGAGKPASAGAGLELLPERAGGGK